MSATWLDIAAETLVPAGSPYRRDPVGWVHEVAQAETWSGQRKILETLGSGRSRIAVKAGHSLGKSFIVGHAVPWWLEAHGAVNSFVVTTAPTFNQVRTILWKEIKRACKAADSRLVANQTELWYNDEIVAMGRKPADWDPDAFQGIHAEHVLVIIDEASGVPGVLWDAVDSLASNEGSAILAIGNPTNPASYFKQACDSTAWHTIRLDGHDSPNFTGEAVSPRLSRMLMSKVWAEGKREEWGGESPMYISRVRGEFPLDSEDTVIPYSWAESCRVGVETNEDGAVELGVDVGAGGDNTVVIERRGMKVGRTWQLDTQDPKKVEGLVLRCIKETGATRVKVDVIGWGWGVYGGVREKAPKNCKVTGINVAKKARDSERFKNRRAELWWEVGRELSRKKEWDLSALTDDQVNQLTTPKYDTDASGRIFIEKKEDIRKRLGASPDDADALLLAFATAPRRRSVRAVSA